MKVFLALLYSALFYPLLMVVTHVFSLFNAKVRRALYPRYRLLSVIKTWRRENPETKRTVLIHCASMGEFEHIKPLIHKLSQTYQARIILSFFSPSGYENVKSFPGVDLILYSPFDFCFLWKKIYRLLRPVQVILSKHDVWPNQVWAAEKRSIPVYLVNASFHAGSSRARFPARFFLKYVYRSIKKIYTITADDERRFLQAFPESITGIAGDTKFDQVQIRKQAARNKNLLAREWLEDSTILLFGSIWPEDTKHLLPGLKVVLQQEEKVKLILVPHQPELKYVLELTHAFKPYQTALYSDHDSLKKQRVLLVDAIGVLADLYKYAQIAYVGGSFRQGIHNVMEPAIYGIPVLYGPRHTNSAEAIRLLQAGGSTVIHNEAQAAGTMLHLIRKKDKREQMGRLAAAFALKNCGATDALIEEWRPLFLP